MTVLPKSFTCVIPKILSVNLFMEHPIITESQSENAV